MTLELGTPSQPDILVNRGALVGVHIGIPRSQSPLHRLPAIIDTGAQLAYYVDIETAQEIGLREIGGIRVPTGSVAGFEYTPAYLAQIHVEPLGVSGRDVPLYGYNIRRLRGAFRFILGREFLKQFRMTERCLNRVIRVRCNQLRWSMAGLGHGRGVV